MHSGNHLGATPRNFHHNYRQLLFNFLEGITNEEVTRIRCNVSYRLGRLR